MPNIKNLEMAEAIANHQHIVIKKSLFGQKAVYTPTGSPVAAQVYEYSQAEGDRLLRLLSMPVDKMAAELRAKVKPQSTAVGPMRLEVCLSADRLFCAMQLFRFVDFRYQPLCDPHFAENADAAVLSQLITNK